MTCAYRSIEDTNLFLPFSQELGMHVLKALGRTYKAISPLLRPFSIQMLLPHARDPVNKHPYGPSQKSCEIHGKSRASTSVRVRQTAYQYDATNVDRKKALRRAAMKVVKARWARKRLFGRVRRIGKKCTYRRIS
jgi:hypothetical protein